MQVSWIKKYLPDDRAYQPKQQSTTTTRSSFGSKPRLDSEGLKKLEGAAMWSLTWFMTKGPSLVLRPMEELKVF